MEAKRDQNFVPTLLAVSSADGLTPITLYADPVTHRLLVDLGGSSIITSPGSSTNNAIPRWNGTTGNSLKDSLVIVDNSGNIVTPGSINVASATIGTSSGIVKLVSGAVAIATSADIISTLGYTPLSSSTGLTPTTGQYKTVITVGASNADYITTGTHDGVTIKAAYAAVLAKGGGTLFIKNGTYNFDDSTDRIFADASNVIIQGESFGGVIFKCTGSLHPGGSDRNGSYGILTIGYNSTTLVSNVIVRNIVFDINHVAKTAGYTIRGGNGTISGAIATQNIISENLVIKNFAISSTDVVEAGSFIISGHTNFGDFGYVDNLMFKNVEFGYSYQNAQGILGTNVTRVTWDGCWVHDTNYNGIYITDYGSVTTHSDWVVKYTRFERNMILTSGNALAHFRDTTQIGVYNFTVDHCYFGPTQNPSTSQDYSLTPYQAGECRISNCFFDRGGSGISIGASISGSFAKTFPIRKFYLENNTFYQMRSCFDPDSTVHMLMTNNMFYEVKLGPIFAPYSEHFPTIIDGNIIYDCNVNDVSGSTSNTRSVFRLNGDGFIVKNNTIIDDRKLTNPLASAGLSQVSGGSLGARTYYVVYTFSNDVGETLASTEQNIAISANNIFKFQTPSYLPPGAKFCKIYVSTTTGTETYQSSIALPSGNPVWTEPTTGLVSGAALPGSNTTDTQTKYGIYELSGGVTPNYINIYQDNYFIGITTPIRKDTSYRRISTGNFLDTSIAFGDESSVELAPYQMGNITGSIALDIFNGQTLAATLTGNITPTLPSGDYSGQIFTLILTQDATGQRLVTWPSNFKKAGGTLTLSQPAAAVDLIRMFWDGTNWNEISRSMNLT